MKYDTQVANQHYRVQNKDALTNEKLLEIIRHFEMYQLPRLEKLNDYYLNENIGIIEPQNRRIGENKSDYRAAHGFASIITDFHVSYLMGIPVKIEPVEDNMNVVEFINDFNERNDIDLHHSNLATDLSKYGRAYELLHYNGSEQNVYVSNPYWTLVIYDESIEMKPIAAVRFPRVEREDGSKYYITVYTEDTITQYEPCELVEGDLVEEWQVPNGFGGVPIIEYSSNRFRLGDYERVIPLIDLYDSSQSDTANYMSDSNDSILVISGDFDSDGIEHDKDTNMLLLPSGIDVAGNQTNLTADYIYKQYDVVGLESYKKRIEEDIHKFSNTPNLTDESFGGNQSGVSIRYKLFSLEQSRSIKERIISQGLAKRYRLINNMSKETREFTEDIGRMKFVFTPNLPESIIEELETFTKAGGQLSNHTLLSQLSFITSVDDEVDKIQTEEVNFGEQSILPDSFR